MRTILLSISALALGLTALGSGSADAQPRGGGYVVALSTPLAAPRQEIVSGVLWKCAGEQCAAQADGSRPAMVCRRVAKTFGAVARFATPTGQLSSDELSRCNGEG